MAELDEELARALVGIVHSEPWMEKAACRGMDPGAFVLSRGRKKDPAMDACSSCTVGAQCENYRDRTGSQGIWNGKIYGDETSEEEILEATEVWSTGTLDARPRKVR